MMIMMMMLMFWTLVHPDFHKAPDLTDLPVPPRKGQVYDAKVIHVNERIGAFVDLGAVANGLIPLKMLGIKR